MSADQYTQLAADTKVYAGPGVLDGIVIAPLTASVTAGLLTIYDNTAESGTVIAKIWITTTVIATGIDLNVKFQTGLYFGFDATLANVSITACWYPE